MFVTKFVELVRGERVLINEVKFGITTTGGKDGPYNNSKRFRGVDLVKYFRDACTGGWSNPWENLKRI